VIAPNTPLQGFSAKEAVWLFVRDSNDLDAEERQSLDAIRQVSQNDSQLSELQSFVSGIMQDKASVVAGLTLP
jgi:hypothetical protein